MQSRERVETDLGRVLGLLAGLLGVDHRLVLVGLPQRQHHSESPCHVSTKQRQLEVDCMDQ